MAAGTVRMMGLTPRSLVWATDIDALPVDRIVRRQHDHLAIGSPSNPRHWWGNFLLFDEPPRPGDGDRWETAFRDAFDIDEVRHRAFAWDRVDGAVGAGQSELVARGYTLDATVGLLAASEEIADPRRGDPGVEIRALDPSGDDDAWAGALAVQLAGNDADEEPIADFEPFARQRLADLRALFAAGRGAWFAALSASGEIVGGCGVVATERRGRFQSVDVRSAHRRRGIAARMVSEAARRASERFGLDSLVIAADPDYHALALYESLGFEVRERVCGARRAPSDPAG